VSVAAVLFIALGLAMDAFAVAVGISSSGRATGTRDSVRLSFHFGLFQFLMPVAGWLAGSTVQPLIEHIDHWIAFGLLAFVGFRMVQSGLSGEPPAEGGNPTRGRWLVLLSLATSIDALAVGLSLAFLNVDVVMPSIAIGIVTFALSYLGMRAGKRLSIRFGSRLEIAGGILLLGIGLKVLASHLL
jgi:manganese efflux pump family protein